MNAGADISACGSEDSPVTAAVSVISSSFLLRQGTWDKTDAIFKKNLFRALESNKPFPEGKHVVRIKGNLDLIDTLSTLSASFIDANHSGKTPLEILQNPIESAKRGFFRMPGGIKLELVADKSNENTLVFHTTKITNTLGRVLNCDVTIIYDIAELRAKIQEKSKEQIERKHKAEIIAAKHVFEVQADKKAAELTSVIEKVRKEQDEKFSHMKLRTDCLDDKIKMEMDEKQRIALRMAEQERITRETKEKSEEAYRVAAETKHKSEAALSLAYDAKQKSLATDLKVRELEQQFNAMVKSIMTLRGSQAEVQQNLVKMNVKFEQVQNLTMILWHEHNNNPNLRARVEAVKAKSIYLHCFQKRLSNLLMSSITRVRVGMDAVDKFKPDLLFASALKIAADHISFVPGAGLLKVAAAGLEFFRTRKDKRERDAQESTNPQFQHEYCIKLSIEIANRLGISFPDKKGKEVAENLADKTLIIILAAIHYVKERLSPDSPQYLDTDSEEFVQAVLNQIMTRPESDFVNFRRVTQLGSTARPYSQSILSGFEARLKAGGDAASDLYSVLPPELIDAAQSAAKGTAQSLSSQVLRVFA